MPEGYGRPVESIAPALLLSGWMDAATPPEEASMIAGHLPNSLHLISRDPAHGPFGLVNESCERRILTEFIRNGSPFGLDTSCLGSMHHEPFRTFISASNPQSSVN